MLQEYFQIVFSHICESDQSEKAQKTSHADGFVIKHTSVISLWNNVPRSRNTSISIHFVSCGIKLASTHQE